MLMITICYKNLVGFCNQLTIGEQSVEITKNGISDNFGYKEKGCAVDPSRIMVAFSSLVFPA